MIVRIALTALLLGVLGLSPAQETEERLEAARSMGARFSGGVFRDRIEAHWLENGQQFWYRVRTGPKTHRFILVDAEAGTRRDAFDHERVATLLSPNATADSLPIATIDFPEPGILEYVTSSERRRLDLTDYSPLSDAARTASANGSTVRMLGAPRVANHNGDSTEITITNQTDAWLELFWVNQVNSPRAYGSIAPGASRTQHTFVGHVWLTRPRGTRQPNLVFEARAGGLAVVDGSWEPAPDSDPPRAPRADSSPDGRFTASLHEFNLLVADASIKEPSIQTHDGTDTDRYSGPFHWSPDGKYLLVRQIERPQKRQIHFVESAPKDQLQPKLHTLDYAKPGDPIPHPRLRLFDLETGAPIPIDDALFPTPWNLTEFSWSADGEQVTFLYNERGHQIQRLIAINPQTGETRALIEEAPKTFVCYSSKTFVHHLLETGEILWMSERDGWNHLYLYDAGSGELKSKITQGEWVVRSVERVDPETRQIWFFAGGVRPEEDPYHLHLCRANFDGTGFIQLTDGDGTHEVTFSPDRRFFIDRFSRVDQPPVIELRRSEDGALICELERADTEALSDAGWRPPERFVSPGRDGKTPIYGIIHRPSHFNPVKRYPVVEQIYAGPHGAHVPKSFSARGHQVAELGFIVVQIDGMGTSHRSKAFHDVAWKNLGDAGFPDRIAWIKAAAKTRPWMDLTRVGIYGGSAGGQNAMRALIAHSDFYHVAVADCGCHDNRMDKIWWNEQWMGWPIPEGGGHYATSSNIEQAHRLKGDLLLIVGELDRNVDPASTMQASAALQRAGIDHDLLVVPGVGHGAAGTPFARERQWDFLLERLLGDRAAPK